MNLSLLDKLKSYVFRVWFLWGVCLLVDIITFLFVYFKIHPGHKTLALRYNVIVGVEWYGSGSNLYFIPGVGLIVLLLNFILFRAFKDNKYFLAPLTIFVTFCVEIILLASAMFLATVN